MAVLSPVAKQQFFDNDGNPAAGYKLYTYATGTSTPQATYTDRAGSVANANPIVLDSRGEATIYLTPEVVYDYVLKTAADATIWTRAGVSAGPTDADSVAFTAEGTGAVARTMQDKGREHVTPEDFGAIGDGDSHPLSERYATLAEAQVDYPFATALTQEIDYCALVAAITSRSFTIGASSTIQSGPEVELADGAVYYCGSDSLQLKRSVKISGAGSGLPNSTPAGIQFAADTRGIIVHHHNTIDDTVESPSTTGGNGSVLEGFRVIGGGGTDSTAHGVWLRARAVCNNLHIYSFAGNGFNIVASAGGGTDREGNANNFKINVGRVEQCGGHGLYVDGADANAGLVIGLDCSGNDKSGFYDSSFLGNTYIGCHTNGNGVLGQVSHGGNRYYCIDEALAGTTDPGTDSSVWVLRGAGGVSTDYPAWVSGNTYYIASSYRTDSNNGQNVFIGCYSEGNQPAGWLVSPTVVIGGNIDTSAPGSSAMVIGSGGGVGTLTAFELPALAGSDNDFTIGFARVANEVVRLTAVGDATNGFQPFMWDNTNGCWITTHNRGAVGSVKYTTNLNTLTCGRTTAVGAGRVFIPGGLWLGNSHTRLRFQTVETAAPTSGEVARGDITWNRDPSASGKAGWICTTGGVAGSTAVFKTFAAIDA